ncbi:MAG: hypothetical protein K6G16_09100 [Lachnospiraceae bacterium]|nr:hypothetical protein [Lachnospiraceae bacterium]
MKIESSAVQMASAGKYVRYQSRDQGTVTLESTDYASVAQRCDGNIGERDHDTGKALSESPYANYTKNGELRDNGASGTNGILRTGNRASSGLSDMKNNLLFLLFGRFLQAGMFGGYQTGAGGLMRSLLSQSAGMLTQTQVDHYEYEELSFRTLGQAQTADGRTITFDMNILMTREFAQVTQIRTPMLSSVLMDPLVVNVGSAVARVSSQTFRFDLDADGTEEEVASLQSGSGFLAFDKNGDGIINDGSELFGAVSGDGFGDLRAYDSDGNGWIDENDEIFSKLRVWYKNGNGEEELVDLKATDVGAIFLDAQRTDFHMTDAGNRLNGMLRSTGVFLKESGGVGTIQHVDLAVRGGDGDLSDQMRAIGGENFVSGFGRGDRTLPDVLILQTGQRRNGDTDDTSESGTESAAEDKEEAARRRREALEEKERLKKEQRERRLEKKRLNEELAEKARQRHEEEEERIAELFAERAQRREESEEAAREKKEEREELLETAVEEKEAAEEADRNIA